VIKVAKYGGDDHIESVVDSPQKIDIHAGLFFFLIAAKSFSASCHRTQN
jgi:hypothetical protein